jgi:flagellar basal-body rod protein FlgB
MDFEEIPVLSTAKRRLDWLTRRQEVLAHNVANADTPGYRPKDLPALTFRSLVRPVPPVGLAATQPNHLAGTRPPDTGPAARDDRRTFETAPAGNAVVLEEQMAKVNETRLAHSLTTQIYRKQLGMLRTAVGSRQ